VAIEHRGPGGISWDIQVPAAGATLIVAGPDGEVFRGEFESSPSYSFINSEGEPLPDGNYNYELIISPYIDTGVRDELQALRDSGNEVELRRLMERYQIPTENAGYSGFFAISGGNLVTSGGTESDSGYSMTSAETVAPVAPDDFAITPADQVILDDLIVDGSICVGMDCVNGESFGFDTLRLKENNLRIRFVDTSSTSSFPSRDWQITVNDSANGGANKFSIDDIDGGRTPFTVEAGAPSNSLYVDDGGQVGFGTSVPAVDLHAKNGNTPTLRLEQDGSSGFTPQTWDIAGNEANFFIRDATNGSQLPFRIFPGADGDALVIDADGDVGLGTTTPDQELDIEANGPNFRLTNTGSGGGIWDFRVNGNSGRLIVTDDPTSDRNPFKIGVSANNNLLKLGIPNADEVNITGKLLIDGTEVTPDYVFEPGYNLESITEHAEFMWQHKHLPALLPAKVDAEQRTVINVAARSQGVLEELEKAHIYIEQLHEAIAELVSRVEQLEQKKPDE
jgi:hypothetical protein